MMEARWPVIAAALTLSACAQQPQPSPRDALRTVLAYEAAEPRDTAVCVAPRTVGTTFDEERRQLREARQLQSAHPQQLAPHQRALAAFGYRTFNWLVPPPPGRMGPRWPPQLAEAEGSSLSAAARPFVSAEPSAAQPLDLGPIPAPFHAGITPDCRARLTLTAPVGTGDLLFVQTSYVCGGLCGVGWLYALRREGSEWRIAAIAWTWVS